MDLKQVVLYSNAFSMIGADSKPDDGSLTIYEEICEWCNENCNGKWMTIAYHDNSTYGSSGRISIKYLSRAKHESPIQGIDFPPSEIKDKPQDRIIAFEDEGDATAFKLRWSGYGEPKE